jgi:hypothetical protein
MLLDPSKRQGVHLEMTNHDGGKDEAHKKAPRRRRMMPNGSSSSTLDKLGMAFVRAIAFFQQAQGFKRRAFHDNIYDM